MYKASRNLIAYSTFSALIDLLYEGVQSQIFMSFKSLASVRSISSIFLNTLNFSTH